MIYTFIPHWPGDLGQAYNNCMQILGEDDWAVFLDADAYFSTKRWYDQIEQLIKTYPDAGLFAAKTNRLHNQIQLVDCDRDNHDIKYHRAIGKKLEEENWCKVTDVGTDHPIGGLVFVISKKVWNRVKFIPATRLVNGTDNAFHEAVINLGLKAYLMEGFYVYHWYRYDE